MFTNWFAEKAPQNLHSTSQNPVLLPTDAPSSTPGLSVEAIPVLTPHDAAVEEVVTKLQDLKESAASETSERSQDPPSISGLVPKNIYDPFEGQPIGLLHASQGGKLWDHLAQVRDLQSEIARMHARMEGLGAAEPMLDRQGSNDGESLTAEEQAKAAQSAEFARLSSRFEERKEAVEKIMMKVRISLIMNRCNLTEAFAWAAR